MYFKADKLDVFLDGVEVLVIFTLEGVEVARATSLILYDFPSSPNLGEFYPTDDGFYSLSGGYHKIYSYSQDLDGFYSLSPIDGFSSSFLSGSFLSSTHLYRSVFLSYIGYIQIYYDWVLPFSFYKFTLPLYKEICCSDLDFTSILGKL